LPGTDHPRFPNHDLGKGLTWRDIREVAAVLRGEKEASPVQGQFPAAPDSLFSELE